MTEPRLKKKEKKNTDMTASSSVDGTLYINTLAFQLRVFAPRYLFAAVNSAASDHIFDHDSYFA